MASLEIKLKHPRGQITESQNCIYGIVCIRGPSVPLTEGTDAEGWITTDFYAKWHVHDRHLQVVRTFRDLRDRFLGDYIPIGNLEWILTRAKFVEAGILVYQGQRLDLIGVLSE